MDEPLTSTIKADAAPDSSDEVLRRTELLEQFKRDYRASFQHHKDWRDEARQLYDMVAGDQWEDADLEQMEQDGKPTVTFNVMGKFLDVVQGLQINNRQDIRFFPREAGDVGVNEEITGAVEWARHLCNAADEDTDAFFDVILTGYGWGEVFQNTDLDPAGWPANERRDPLEMYPDPNARRRNLADARFVIRVRGMTKLEYKETFDEDPEMAAGILEMEDATESDAEVVPQPDEYAAKSAPGAAVAKGKIPVADYQYFVREWRTIIRVDSNALPPEIASMIPPEQELPEKAAKALSAQLTAAGIPHEMNRVKRKVYYRAFIAGNEVKQYGESPCQSGFTHKCMTGKRDRNKNVWYGLGRNIKDPQLWVNKFLSSILFILMSNSKGGLLAEEDAFEDPRKAEADWAKANSIVYTRAGAVAEGRVIPKPPPQYPEGLDRLLTFSLESLPQVSGLNVEVLGLADRVQAGVVEAQRKQSAMAIISWAFDSMRRYYIEVGRTYYEYIRDYVSEGTLIRVSGDKGAKYVPLIKDKMTGTFDVIVDEAPTSVNMRERVWAVLEGLIPQLLQAGIVIPMEIIDYAPIPSDLAQKWKAELENAREQGSEQAKKQQEQVMQQFMAEIKKTMAEAMNKDADSALKQAQTIKTAAEAGIAQAGGSNVN